MPAPPPANLAALQAGLSLQTRPKIPIDETGMGQATLNTLCLNDLFLDFLPSRGTPISELPAADDGTSAAVFASLDYLNVHSVAFTRNGHSPGIGTLEILCYGIPKFDDFFWGGENNSDHVGDRITIPVTELTGTPTRATIIYWQDTGSDEWQPQYIILIDYYSLDYTASYAAEALGTMPRLIPASGDVDDPVDLPFFLSVVKNKVAAYYPASLVDATGTPIAPVDYVPGAPAPLPGDYETWVKYNIKVGDWRRRQLGGKWWGVTETGRLTVQGKIPATGTIVGYLGDATGVDVSSSWQ